MASKKPTHRIYAVTKREGAKNFWQEIGVAWAHEKGDGMSLKLNFLPLNTSDIVIRVPKDKTEADAPEMAEGEV